MISQTVEYALLAMSFLASRPGASVTCATISRGTRVPPGYLSKIMRDLVCAELVRSFRGPHRGFALARDCATISLLEIVAAVEPMRRAESDRLEEPIRAAYQAMHQCLDDAMSQIEQTFRRTTLSSVLACGADSKGSGVTAMGKEHRLKGASDHDQL